MSDHSFMDRVKNFLGLGNHPPRNDFRNPFWATEEDEDDDDELYDRHNIRREPRELHQEFNRQVNEMLKSFGVIFGDMKMLTPENFESIMEHKQPERDLNEGTFGDYYLKPEYDDFIKQYVKKDTDLDGHVSTGEISGLLNGKKSTSSDLVPFESKSNIKPGRSYFQSVITTSMRKPDGSIETRRIVKDQNGVVEETTTQMFPETSKSNMEDGPGFNNLATDFSSFWRHFN